MRISPHWLKDFVNIPADERKLADALTLAGVAVEAITEINGKTAYEMEITTNRPDAMNHYGVAREISAIYGTELKPLTATLPARSGKSSISVTIEEPELCGRFTGQEIRNARIAPSKGEVLERFRDLEQKPINNAADATNYVLLMMGKPTHAFDADKLAGGKIIVRLARTGETVKTLDGVERKLHPEDLVIADAEKPVALAGVMGGWDSMITESTKNVFIESAWFDPSSIRKTSRRHAIHTDASHRFERGADWASTIISTELVAQIILESGGELTGNIVDVIARNVGHPPVQLRLAEVKRILGKEIPAPEIERMLTKLGFKLTSGSAGTYMVEIPTWRLDVEREIDVIEEVARVHGYDKFPNTLPSFSSGVVELPTQEKDDKIRSTLLALGYNEALSSTFMPRNSVFHGEHPVTIANPLNEEASAMRTSLVQGMLEMMGRNLNRGVHSVRLFEHGHIYSMETSETKELDSLCFAATPTALAGKDENENFRIFKGDVESLLNGFDGSLQFTASSSTILHPYVSADVTLNGKKVCSFGKVHWEAKVELNFKRLNVYIAEVFLEQLYNFALRMPRYKKLSRFPAVERDFSFVFDDAVAFAQVVSAIESLRQPELQSVEPQEIFRGGNIGAGRYSILIRATFQSNERTLRDDEVNAWAAQIIDALKGLGGTQR
jgi:phenylalanyl-tRNA synthetase beta chain